MKLNSFKNFIFGVLIFFLSTNSSYSEKINNIKIIGNERISDEVIILFSDVSVGSEINLDDLNVILKKIYDSNFDNVKVELQVNELLITVKEFPIIDTIKTEGIKAEKI